MKKITLISIGSILLWFALIIYLSTSLNNEITAHGGIKQITINIGKEVKDIINQINE